MSVPAFADIEAAAKRLAGQAVVTPLIESPALNERLGLRVLVKPETLQRVGAFKFRGAFNRLSQIAPADRPRGVVAFSSGNHAQGVALAARLLDMPAVIVMPADAPAVKVSATRGFGAEVVFYDRMTESREAIAARLAEERGAVIVPAYDDPDIIAGQGTAGLELARQVQALGAELDLVVGPVGGGGLMAGVAIAVQTLSPKTRIVGVEPELYDDARRSLASGRRETAAPTVRTLCDSLETPSTGELTFPILRERLSAIVTVNDSEVAEALRLAFSTLKLAVEPGGAVGLAALMAAKVPEAAPGACVGLVLSGGNVDPDLFARVMRGEF
ncbi:MAG: threonine/serine dehydratase [Phenylobacterium sp.]|uniref:threonine ammonia-lyase n=1 Tax=Phenylobacterium sp. TaxID=1871053 RepID=UPI0025D00DEB|nr:threonine/serine dehydratase [Phenylobacterium sp.]MCA3736841.1 threonine/serine dehydratase [Phenylobacterium sp.]MCA4915081.1 threonine/serine dehydratase [Phenylobacterium sp.]